MLLSRLDRRHSLFDLPGQYFDNMLQCRVGAFLRLLGPQRRQRMSDTHGLVIGIAEDFGMLAGGIHEGLGAEEDGRDATVLEGQDVVHTARHTGASVADSGNDEIAALG
jgi:hypothetical protein